MTPHIYDKLVIGDDRLTIVGHRADNVVTYDDAGFRIERAMSRLVWAEALGAWTDDPPDPSWTVRDGYVVAPLVNRGTLDAD